MSGLRRQASIILFCNGAAALSGTTRKPGQQWRAQNGTPHQPAPALADLTLIRVLQESGKFSVLHVRTHHSKKNQCLSAVTALCKCSGRERTLAGFTIYCLLKALS